MTVSKRFALSAGVLALAVSTCSAQLRIATWNTLSCGGSLNPGVSTVLEAIGNEAVPGVGIARPVDLLILQEQSGNNASTQAIVNILNGLYGAGTYARADVVGYQYDQHYNSLVYNTQSLALEETTYRQAGGAPRATGRYRLGLVGYDDVDLWVYNSHCKAGSSASDQNRRAAEAIEIRWHASFGSDYLPAEADIIYAGDLNTYSAFEDGYHEYSTLTENPYAIFQAGGAPWGTSGNGQGVDPVNLPAPWHDSAAYRVIHTQSPSTGTGSGGGMDDRFDHQIVSTEMYDGEGLSYIGPGVGDCPASYHSYRSFGNNGTHSLNQNISTGTGAAPNVLAAIETASDHLPVVADYQVPAMMDVQADAAPGRVIVGAAVSLEVTITNAAPVSLPIGADELDYALTTTGALSGSADGTEYATGDGDTCTVTLDTSAPGSVSGDIRVLSDSAQAANADVTIPVACEVLSHAEASLAGGEDVDALTVDFGGVAPGTGLHQIAFDLHEIAGTGGAPAADLDIDTVTGGGDLSVLSTDLTGGLAVPAGGAIQRLVVLDSGAGEEGYFNASWTIDVSDEDIPGETEGDSLTLAVTAYVAIMADADMDGEVGASDLGTLARNFGASEAGWTEGDFDGDGSVAASDLGALARNFGNSANPSVPEPLSLWFLSAGLAGLAVRRSRGSAL